MARPRRDLDGKNAFERIEDAFWHLLAEKPFNKITISALSKTAQVNHNLIYYYFDNVEDMAKQLFERTVSGDIPQHILSMLLNENASHENIIHSPELMMRIRRARLFMRSDSSYLNSIVKEKLQSEWLTAVGVERSQLTDSERADIEFIFSGIVSVVGSPLFDENPEAIATLYQRPLGRAIGETLKGFGAHSQS